MVMAFTSGLVNAHSGLPHNVAILANGYVRHVRLPDLIMQAIKVICGKLTLLTSSFHVSVFTLLTLIE